MQELLLSIIFSLQETYLSIICSLQETYLSADDLRINLWHMEITDQSFNIVDIKPANMEELTEVNSSWFKIIFQIEVLVFFQSPTINTIIWLFPGDNCFWVPSKGVQSVRLLVQQGDPLTWFNLLLSLLSWLSLSLLLLLSWFSSA